MKLFSKTPTFQFMKHRFLFVGISGLLVAASLFSLATKGLNFGTDFLGGIKLQYQFPNAIGEEEVRALLETMHVEGASVVQFGNATENRLSIKVAHPKEEITSYGSTITPKLKEKFGEKVLLEMEESIGATVGAELQRKGILAVLFSFFCMLIYIGFRFDFLFAPGAILALFHDVILVVGLFSFLQIEFNLTILAACLTIVGFSINDTIVIFDRVREHIKRITPETLESVVNLSINETLSRTFNTSFTVFLVVLVLYFFGGATLENFSLAMLVGVIAGTYSTVFIACAAYVGMHRLSPKLEKLWGKK